MRDPVELVREPQVYYDRISLESYFKRHGWKSPSTGENVVAPDIRPCIALEAEINANFWQKYYPWGMKPRQEVDLTDCPPDPSEPTVIASSPGHRDAAAGPHPQAVGAAAEAADNGDPRGNGDPHGNVQPAHNSAADLEVDPQQEDSSGIYGAGRAAPTAAGAGAAAGPSAAGAGADAGATGSWPEPSADGSQQASYPGLRRTHPDEPRWKGRDDAHLQEGEPRKRPRLDDGCPAVSQGSDMTTVAAGPRIMGTAAAAAGKAAGDGGGARVPRGLPSGAGDAATAALNDDGGNGSGGVIDLVSETAQEADMARGEVADDAVSPPPRVHQLPPTAAGADLAVAAGSGAAAAVVFDIAAAEQGGADAAADMGGGASAGGGGGDPVLAEGVIPAVARACGVGGVAQDAAAAAAEATAGAAAAAPTDQHADHVVSEFTPAEPAGSDAAVQPAPAPPTLAPAVAGAVPAAAPRASAAGPSTGPAVPAQPAPDAPTAIPDWAAMAPDPTAAPAAATPVTPPQLQSCLAMRAVLVRRGRSTWERSALQRLSDAALLQLMPALRAAPKGWSSRGPQSGLSLEVQITRLLRQEEAQRRRALHQAAQLQAQSMPGQLQAQRPSRAERQERQEEEQQQLDQLRPQGEQQREMPQQQGQEEQQQHAPPFMPLRPQQQQQEELGDSNSRSVGRSLRPRMAAELMPAQPQRQEELRPDRTQDQVHEQGVEPPPNAQHCGMPCRGKAPMPHEGQRQHASPTPSQQLEEAEKQKGAKPEAGPAPRVLQQQPEALRSPPQQQQQQQQQPQGLLPQQDDDLSAPPLLPHPHLQEQPQQRHPHLPRGTDLPLQQLQQLLLASPPSPPQGAHTPPPRQHDQLDGWLQSSPPSSQHWQQQQQQQQQQQPEPHLSGAAQVAAGAVPPQVLTDAPPLLFGDLQSGPDLSPLTAAAAAAGPGELLAVGHVRQHRGGLPPGLQSPAGTAAGPGPGPFDLGRGPFDLGPGPFDLGRGEAAHMSPTLPEVVHGPAALRLSLPLAPCTPASLQKLTPCLLAKLADNLTGSVGGGSCGAAAGPSTPGNPARNSPPPAAVPSPEAAAQSPVAVASCLDIGSLEALQRWFDGRAAAAAAARPDVAAADASEGGSRCEVLHFAGANLRGGRSRSMPPRLRIRGCGAAGGGGGGGAVTIRGCSLGGVLVEEGADVTFQDVTFTLPAAPWPWRPPATTGSTSGGRGSAGARGSGNGSAAGGTAHWDAVVVACGARSRVTLRNCKVEVAEAATAAALSPAVAATAVRRGCVLAVHGGAVELSGRCKLITGPCFGLAAAGAGSTARAETTTAMRCGTAGFLAAAAGALEAVACTACDRPGTAAAAAANATLTTAGGDAVRGVGYVALDGGRLSTRLCVALRCEYSGFLAAGPGAMLNSSGGCWAEENGWAGFAAVDTGTLRAGNGCTALSNGVAGFAAYTRAALVGGERCRAEACGGHGWVATQGSWVVTGRLAVAARNGDGGFAALEGSALFAGEACRAEANASSGFLALAGSQLAAGAACRALLNGSRGFVAEDGGARLVLGPQSRAERNGAEGFAALTAASVVVGSGGVAARNESDGFTAANCGRLDASAGGCEAVDNGQHGFCAEDEGSVLEAGPGCCAVRNRGGWGALASDGGRVVLGLGWRADGNALGCVGQATGGQVRLGLMGLGTEL